MAKIDRAHFVVLEEDLMSSGWLTLCKTFQEEDVEERQTDIAEQWIGCCMAERRDPRLVLDSLSTEDQE